MLPSYLLDFIQNGNYEQFYSRKRIYQESQSVLLALEIIIGKIILAILEFLLNYDGETHCICIYLNVGIFFIRIDLGTIVIFPLELLERRRIFRISCVVSSVSSAQLIFTW